MDIVGVIPAAGRASRLGSLPCSKEILPIGFWEEGHPLAGQPKAVCHYLIERMHHAGARRICMVVRSGKWDIPAYLRDGGTLGVSIAYLMMDLPYGPPFSLNQAYPFVKDSLVLTGFPDLLFEPFDAFEHLVAKQASTGADVVLGLLPTSNPRKMDMVDVSRDGRVRDIVIKPAETELQQAWIIAAWTPTFSAFLDEYVRNHERALQGDPAALPAGTDVHVGDVIRAALERGLCVQSVEFPDGRCLDVGTPEDLAAAVRSEGRLDRLDG